MGRRILKLYPQARLFVAGGTISRLGTASRRWAGSRPATTMQSLFARSFESFRSPISISTALSKSRWRNWTRALASRTRKKETTAESEGTGKGSEALGVRLRKRADRESKDNALTFEELGVDQIFWTKRSLQEPGVRHEDEPNRRPAETPTATALRYVPQDPLPAGAQCGRGVVFATARRSQTLWPRVHDASLSGAEMLAERNVEHFDSWRRTLRKP